MSDVRAVELHFSLQPNITPTGSLGLKTFGSFQRHIPMQSLVLSRSEGLIYWNEESSVFGFRLAIMMGSGGANVHKYEGEVPTDGTFKVNSLTLDDYSSLRLDNEGRLAIENQSAQPVSHHFFIVSQFDLLRPIFAHTMPPPPKKVP